MPNEEGQVVKDEEVVLETSEQESTPDEPETTVAEEPTEEPSETDSESDEPHDQSDETDETEEQPEEKPKGKAEERKEQLKSEIEELESKVEGESQDPRNMEIRELVARRNELKQRVEKTNAEAYRVATEDELLDQINPETGEYFNRLEAKLAVMEQKEQIRDYTNQVAETQLTLSTEAQKALQEFPMFDSHSPEYNEGVAKQVDAILGQSLVFDQKTGAVIGSHVSPYELYKAVSQSAQAGTVAGQVKAQKATERMLATADSSGGAQQATRSFDKLSSEEMAAKLRAKGHDI